MPECTNELHLLAGRRALDLARAAAVGHASNAVLDISTIASTPAPSSASSCATPPPDASGRSTAYRSMPSAPTSSRDVPGLRRRDRAAVGRRGPSRPSPAGRARSRGTATTSSGPRSRQTNDGLREPVEQEHGRPVAVVACRRSRPRTCTRASRRRVTTAQSRPAASDRVDHPDDARHLLHVVHAHDVDALRRAPCHRAGGPLDAIADPRCR